MVGSVFRFLPVVYIRMKSVYIPLNFFILSLALRDMNVWERYGNSLPKSVNAMHAITFNLRYVPAYGQKY